MASRNMGYMLGYACGILHRKLEQEGFNDFENLYQIVKINPLTAFRRMHEKGFEYNIITEDIKNVINECLSGLRPDMQFNNPTDDILNLWTWGLIDGQLNNPLPEATKGAEILAIRQNLKLSQERFAEIIGANQAEISRWETNKITPSDETMSKIYSLTPGNIK